MKKALLLVDIQNDFLPGGALAVPDGDKICEPINGIISKFEWVLASKDWHPVEHISFASRWDKKVGDVIQRGHIMQRLWPDHCIQNTPGSDFPNALNVSKIHKTFYKGYDPEKDSYSIFLDQTHQNASSILHFLHAEKINTLYIAGLAADYCVKFTVLDALQLGFKVYLIQDCTRAVNVQETDGEKALQLMQSQGCILTLSSELNF